MSSSEFPKKITDIKSKGRTEYVLLIFDTGEYLRLHLDLVYKHQLSKQKVIEEEKYNEIIRDSKILAAKRFAFNYCTKSARAEKQVIMKLKAKGLFNTEIEEIINFLKEFKLINDKEFINTAVNYYKKHKNFGNSRIKLELLRKGVEKELIEETLSEFRLSDDEEYDSAKKILEKRKSKLQSKSGQKLYVYISSLLKQNGINSSVSRRIIDEVNQARISTDEQE